MTRTRMKPQERKEQILKAAITLAKVEGYKRITRDGVAAVAGVSMGTITHHFGTVPQLQRDLMRYAVRHEIPEIIAQGLAHGDAQAKKMPQEKRREILNALAAS